MSKIFIVGKTYRINEVTDYANFVCYETETKHEIYSIGDSKLPFQRKGKDKLKYLGIYHHKKQVK
jgi:hypothetical protein